MAAAPIAAAGMTAMDGGVLERGVVIDVGEVLLVGLVGLLERLERGLILLGRGLLERRVLLDAGLQISGLRVERAVLAERAVDGLVESLRFRREDPRGCRGDERDGDRDDGSDFVHFFLSSGSGTLPGAGLSGTIIPLDLFDFTPKDPSL